MPITYSPLRYPGGKTSLLQFVQSVMEANVAVGATYIEPFCGGAGVALGLLFSGVAGKIVLNDLDQAIYSFWKTVVENHEQLICKINECRVDVEEWKIQKKIFQNSNSDRFDRGFATFYLNRCNRSGILSANPIGGLNQNGKWKIDARFKKEMLINKIQKIAERKSDISIRNDDIFKFIQNISKKQEFFVYFDPPYLYGGPQLYLNAFSQDMHAALATVLKKYNFPWIMTYDEHNFIKEIYSYCYLYRINLNYFAQTKRTASELLIIPRQTLMPNFEPPGFEKISDPKDY